MHTSLMMAGVIHADKMNHKRIHESEVARTEEEDKNWQKLVLVFKNRTVTRFCFLSQIDLEI